MAVWHAPRRRPATFVSLSQRVCLPVQSALLSDTASNSVLGLAAHAVPPTYDGTVQRRVDTPGGVRRPCRAGVMEVTQPPSSPGKQPDRHGLDIAKRYEIAFLEIGTDKDHVHFLVQSVPSYSPTTLSS